MEIIYQPKALEDIKFWKQSGNKQIQNKITLLLESIQETPFEGLGKPEPLKYSLSGIWSRRITLEHRLLYEFKENKIQVYSLKDHY